MANCSYTIDGKTYSKSELKAWLYDGGLEQLYPDGMSGVEPKQDVKAEEPKLTTKGTQLAGKAEANIQDFGEKLEGAKKFTYTFKESVKSDVDVREVPLSKSFPQPDYEKLIAGGLDPKMAAFIAQLRTAIPTKPSKPNRVAQWAFQVTEARLIVSRILDGKVTFANLSETVVLSNSFYQTLPDVLSIADKVLPSQIKDLGRYTLDKVHYTLFRDQKNVNKWDVRDINGKSGMGGLGNVTHFDSKEQALEFIKNKVTDEFDGKPIAKFDVWSERGKPGYYLGKKVTSRKYIELKHFDTVNEARAYAREHNDELVEMLSRKKSMRDVRRAENNERVGKDYRNGKNATAEMFAKEFGFRGVQFGNWVVNDKRQQDLNNAYDGLKDLADVLGIPTRALSLNGSLGLAFGARGTGGIDPASAHYEPGHVVINLTRDNGAGSLAHEWWHALDNYFGKQENRGEYLTETGVRRKQVLDGKKYRDATPEDFAVREQVFKAWQGVTKAIKEETQLVKRSQSRDSTRSKDYWSTVREMTARTFERYIIEKLAQKGYENDYLANIISEEANNASNELFGTNEEYQYPLKTEMDAVNRAYDKLFGVMETKETDQGVALYSKSQAELSKSQPTNGSTVAQVTAMLPKRVGKMLEAGNLKVVQSAQEAIDAGALSFDAGSGVEGFYNPKTDELYIIADNVNQDTVQSVLAHELLHRGLATDAKLKGAYDRFQSDMQSRFSNAAKGIGTKADKDAYARVMGAKTPEKDRIEEFGAYMVSAWQQNPDSVSGAIRKAIQDFIAAIRAFLVRNGLDMGFIKSLTPADLAAMSRYGAKEGGSKMELTTNGIKASNTEADSQRQYREIEEHFFNKDGSEKPGAMLAPNGKRSKLTKYQWIMVRTDNFKRFYGDWERDGYRLENLGQDAGESTYSGGIYSRNNGAAPISETGEPLVFYHGTSDDIKTGFDLEHKNRKDFGWLGDGVYVANVPLFAEMYANTKQGDADPNILPLFVAVKKPYIATLEVKKKLKHATQAEIQRITKAMQKDGFDGAFLKYSDGTIELVAFNPSHVKSAVSNTGAFDGANPDIRYSLASKAQTLLKDKQSKFDTAIHQLQDRYIDLKRQMEKVVKNGGEITANPYQAEELYHQRAASRIKEFNEKELTPILQGLHDNEISMDDFQKFLHSRHAESRNAVMAERNPSQDIIDAKLSEAEAALDALDGSDKKAMREAQKEVRKWRKAKPFNGTEEERLSLSGMSNQDARDFIAGLPADKAKAMSALGDKIDRITNKTLDLLVNYGMETQETVDALKAQWEHYVPLHRDEAHPDNNGQPIGRGFSVRGSGLKTATGSNAEVTNILAHLAAQREQMIRRGEKNRVSNILAEFIKQHPDDEFATVDKVEMQDSLNDDGLVEGRMEPFFKRSMKDNVVMFRKDGKDHAITFNDRREDTQRLAMSLKNMDAGLDAVESIFAKGTRWMAAVNTQYNIVFGLFNLARDAQGMALNMSTTPLAGKQKQVFSHLWKSIKIIYGSERNLQNLDPELKRYYDAFNKSGGTTGYSQMFDDIRSRNKSLEAQLKDMGAGKGKKLLMAAKQWVSDYNSVMENATRLSVFIEAKNQGLNNDEAASIAKNITVNFNRKGSYTTKVGALYAFFNASMQGTARLAETMKGPKGKQILAGGVLAGAVSTILGMMVMGDDEWEKIPEFVRERSLIIPTSKTGYITLPMPLGFHILPNIGRKVVEMVAGSSKVSPQQRLLELVAATAGAFNPLGGGDFMQIVTPTVMDPMVELARNKDWTGKPIYREDMNSLNPTPGFTRTKDTATSGAKMAAYAINKLTGGTDAKQGLWSPTPDQIDYLLGQILGGTGREVSKVWQTAESAITGEELPAYKRPLVGRLYGETKGNAAEKGAYYDNVKRLNEHEAEIKWLRENKQSNKVSEYLRDNPEAKLVLKANGIESSIRKLKSIRDKLEGAGANKQRLTAIETQIVSQMKRLNDAVSNVNH